MNFLAHLVLTRPRNAAGYIGALAPDLVRIRRPDLASLHPDVARAVHLHRLIDRVTDTHPAFLHSKALLFPEHGRFAGIILDVLYDHVLCATWDQWQLGDRLAFTHEVRDALDHHRDLMPQAMQTAAHRLTQQNWLDDYATHAGIMLTFQRMQRRLRERFDRPIDFSRVGDSLLAHQTELTDDFRTLFAALRRLDVPVSDPSPAHAPATAPAHALPRQGPSPCRTVR